MASSTVAIVGKVFHTGAGCTKNNSANPTVIKISYQVTDMELHHLPFALSSTAGMSSIFLVSWTWWARGGLGGGINAAVSVPFFASFFSSGFCLWTKSLLVPLSDLRMALILERLRGFASSLEYLWLIAFRVALPRLTGVADTFPDFSDSFLTYTCKWIWIGKGQKHRIEATLPTLEARKKFQLITLQLQSTFNSRSSSYLFRFEFFFRWFFDTAKWNDLVGW